MNELNSRIIKGANKEGFQNGTSKYADRICYGYSKAPDGSLMINEKEAKVICKIFSWYLSGDSLGKIVNRLHAAKIPSPEGKAKWNSENIRKQLRNEKYTGKVLLQKTITQNGKQIRNAGEADKYLYSGNHPAIISEELFADVQNAMAQRSRKRQDQKLIMDMSGF